MTQSISRRRFLQATGAAGATGAGAVAADVSLAPAPLKIIGIACSPRKGKTTTAGLTLCLDAAQAVAPKRLELVELADLEIPDYLAAGIPLKPGHKDDFPAVASKLTDPRVAGLIIGTPVYFGSLSALCKAFLDRCVSLRKPKNLLANKVVGALAVGGSRSGGQELAIQCIHAALFRHEVIIVGDGPPACHTGASLWNNGKDDISQDEFGKSTAVSLGRRVAEVILGRRPPGERV